MDKLRARTIIGSIVAAVLKNERPAEDMFGDPLPAMEIIGNVAVIPLTGVIAINVPDWLKEFGFNLTDANDIEEEIAQALTDQRVELIVFDVDSPGGWRSPVTNFSRLSRQRTSRNHALLIAMMVVTWLRRIRGSRGVHRARRWFLRRRNRRDRQLSGLSR